ncbi:MAG: ABC transporter substrate-binding protein [Bacteroidales bacterium]|jgi:iron complex transport system substrate-binding protein|nr:ABC transporter substrate-binding protein [Bacteroidales bacterium]
MKHFIILFFLIIACFSCQKEQKIKINDNQIVITDYYNRKVIIKKDVQRIVSLSPGITELVFDLQKGDKIIGRTDYCSFPPQVLKIQSVGGITNANVEQIISLQPDIVISSSMLSKSKLEQIEKAGVSIIALPERNNVEGVYQTIEILGKILGQETLAQQKINAMKQRILVIKEKNNYSILPKVYYVIGFGAGGDFSAGKNTYIHEIITLAGGDNIAAKIVNWSFSKEELFANEPDYIFIRKEDYSQFIHTAPYTNLKAVRLHKVYPIESSLMDCQTIRSVEAIEQISYIIHNFQLNKKDK